MRLRTVAVLTATILGLTACSSSAASTEEDRSITISTPVDLDSFDPNVVPTGIGGMLKQQVIETLMTPDQKPLLATEWKRHSDNVTWEFTLREGVKFTNGDSFNAETAKWSLERLMSDKSENSSLATRYRTNVESVTAVDADTLEIRTKGVVPDFLDILPESYMLTPAIEKLPNFGKEVIGTGAYKLKSWSQDEKLELVANEDYWGKKPYFTDVTVRPIGESSVRATELRAGGADIIYDVAPQDFSVINTKDTKLVERTSTQSLRIHMKADAAPFDNVKVRQAMNYGTDRETILKTILEGRGELMGQPTSPGIFGYNKNLAPYPYNPDRAKALLAEAGYSAGTPVKVELQMQQDRFPGAQAVADALTGQLRQVGFDVTVKMNSSATFLKNFNSVGNGFVVMSQESNVTELMPSNFYSKEKSYKRYNYSNSTVDGLIAAAHNEPDDAKREKIYQELNAVLHEDAPWVFLWNPKDNYGINSSISGFAPNGVGFIYVRDLARS